MGHDQVNITGSATLAGTLDVRLSGGFAPVLGNTFDLFTFASRSGMFQNVLFPVLQGPAAFQLDYSNPTKVTLRMVTPQSINWVGPAPSSTWSNPANWSGGTVPTTNSDPQLFNSVPTAKEAVLDSDATVHRVTIGGTTATMGLAVPSNKTLHATDRVVIEEGGRLDLLQGQVTSSAIDLAGGTLRGASETATPVVVQQGTIDVPDPRQALTLEGPLMIDPDGSLLKTGPGDLIVAGPLADGGSITVSDGTMVAPAAKLDSLTIAGEGTIFRLRPGSGTMVLKSLVFAADNPAAVATKGSTQMATIPEPQSIMYVVCAFVVLLVLRKFRMNQNRFCSQTVAKCADSDGHGGQSRILARRATGQPCTRYPLYTVQAKVALQTVQHSVT
jgi:autotransporter-associated beta strand protein